MTRYKWYRIGLPNGLDSLLKRLRADVFTADKARGFVPGVSASGAHAFRFAWRSNIVITTLDLDGNSVRQSVSTVSLCEFALFSKFGVSWLRVVDPPRSVKDLLDALEAAVGLGFYAEVVVFTQSVYAALLRSVDECRLVSFKGVGSVTSQKAIARIEVAGKEGLDLGRMEFLRGMEYSVDYALYEVVYRRERGQVAFSMSGVVKIGGNLQPHLLELVENELPRKIA